MTILPSRSLSRPQFRSGLVSWWRGEGNALDALGTNNGTLLNGLGFCQGKVGQCFNFDGVDDGISVADSTSLNFGPDADFSIETWINPGVSETDGDTMSHGGQALRRWRSGL